MIGDFGHWLITLSEPSIEPFHVCTRHMRDARRSDSEARAAPADPSVPCEMCAMFADAPMVHVPDDAEPPCDCAVCRAYPEGAQ